MKFEADTRRASLREGPPIPPRPYPPRKSERKRRRLSTADYSLPVVAPVDESADALHGVSQDAMLRIAAMLVTLQRGEVAKAVAARRLAQGLDASRLRQSIGMSVVEFGACTESHAIGRFVSVAI